MSSNKDKPPFITGCGVLSPLGTGVPAFWEGLVAGRCGVGPIRSFDATHLTNANAGEVQGFDAERQLAPEDAARLDRMTQFALAAAREAIEQSGLTLGGPRGPTVGVILATTLGGMLIGEEYLRARRAGRPFHARSLLQHPYYAVASRLARALGVTGPVLSPSIACASGTQAVGMAAELIRCGHADAFIAGGVETMCDFVVAGFNCLRATTPDVVRPFDERRKGLLLGEGAAVLVVESHEHARARGGRALAEVAGTALSGDAVHMTAPARDGCGAMRAMRAALGDAGLDPADVDFVSAHGTGTVYNDAMEMVAIREVLGDRVGDVPVNSIKGAIGHTLGAAGSFEAIMCTRIFAEGIIPPTVNCEVLDPACALDIVRGDVRRHAVRTALSTSSAFAGNNAAIVLRSHE